MPTAPTLFVSAATGHLGGLVIDALLETLPASAIVAGVRDPAKEAAVAIRNKGVEVRVADYARPETLASALAGVDRLLLISGSEIGQRTAQHRNVIASAKDAGVGQIAYTSILHADTSPLFLAEEHRDTESALKASGIPFVLLRNGWYTEVYTWRIAPALRHGVFLGASGAGRISSAARADYARAAAVVLASGDHTGRTYELAGDASYTLAEFVAAVAEASGKPLPYRNMDPDAYRTALLGVGVPELFATILSDTDAGVAKGALFDDGGDLARLIGQPTTPFRATLAEFF
ncbi:NAD(P)-dependent oxidoreductase [Gluconacetobacter liquefaciens]|uniref:NAD(P)H dehydrogenase (Quinone) n=1 Tax=Gluconacetobacter liquefaciens TaxID=89584 RepID=A0A370G8K2_GLULI|nr:NAD(P)H-binding protein [Gluconacetobacter liquefaciens]MBB2185466.1 NAD(P)H-binding protein [Gluconacetobacter liquefaciens]RDI39269.1 NAD(P)H dehydrogenase (quinone) [Gluconacetobacter liquefaciens]GBQ94472.1 putative nucleoside-diphosphate-sugar epimerase [Gluconacetobacter liquefaciens NRIC 0522]GEB38041.1 NAD(P)-dependent oxidoreductase [Gluconacetobacter liquefaciens]